MSIAFLAGAVALTLFGAFILFDSLMSLVLAHHPTIGTKVLFGHQFWSGWLMIGVLFLSATATNGAQLPDCSPPVHPDPSRD